MRAFVVVAGLALIACSDGFTAPTPPAPPSYPAMLGGWSGVNSDTWVAEGNITGARTCNETWLVTSQTGGDFSGLFQSTPGSLADCARSGTINGSVGVGGDIAMSHGNTGVRGTCSLVSGDPIYRGVVSPGGNVTVGAIYFLRCPFGRGTIDYRFTTSVVMSRR